MNTRLLVTLLAVHRYGSMAEAARRLNITHGAVAQQIRALEAELKVDLARRAGKVVHLTEEAHRIVAQAQKILDDVAALEALAHTDTLKGTLRLGAGNTALTGRVPDILAALGSKYPDIQVNLRPGLSSDFYELVEGNVLDAAIALEPAFATSKSVGWHPLYEESFFLLAASRHEGQDPLALLKSEPFIRYHRDTWAGRQIDGFLKTNNIVPAERFELTSTEAIARLVHKDLGVAIVPSAWNLWQQGLNVISMAVPCPPRRFGLIWARSSLRLRLVEAFLQAALEVYGKGAAVLD